MAKSLDISAAELSLKDKVTKNLKKIDKSLDKSNKRLLKTEKQGKQTEKQMTKLSKSFDKVGRSSKKLQAAGFGRGGRGERFRQGAQRVGRGARRGGAGAARGIGAFTGGVGAIPIVGGVIAATLGAISTSRSNFIAKVSLQKELKKLANDYSTAFSKRAQDIIADVKGPSFFRGRDVQTALTGLQAGGVGGAQIAKNAQLLRTFGKAQGLTSLTEAMQNLSSGAIKAGRGLSVIDIKRLQVLGPMLKDVARAPIAFEQITNILKSANLEEQAKRTEKSTLAAAQANANWVDNMRESAVVQAGSAKAFQTGQDAIIGTNKAIDAFSNATAPAVSKSIKGISSFVDELTAPRQSIRSTNPIEQFKNLGRAAQDFSKGRFKEGILGRKIPAKADGGPKKRGQLTLVGERGPELLDESISGNIVSTQRTKSLLGGGGGGGQMSQGGGSTTKNITFSPTINVNVNGGDVNLGESIGQQVRNELENMVNSMRFETGMSLQG